MRSYLPKPSSLVLFACFGIAIAVLSGSACGQDADIEKKQLRVAVVQFDAKPGELDKNLAEMERLAKQAVENRAELVLFHELATVDYMDDMGQFAEKIPDGPSCRRMGELAQRLGCYLSFGMPERNGEKLHIAQVFFSPEKYLYHYRKTWLCQIDDDCGFRNEWARYNPGDGPEIFNIAGIRATCFICADGESPRCVEQARALKPELVFFPINRGARVFHGYPEIASQVGAITLIANRVGKSHTRDCLGGSVIYDAKGKILREANRNHEEEILFYDLVIPVKAS